MFSIKCFPKKKRVKAEPLNKATTERRRLENVMRREIKTLAKPGFGRKEV
jgi:hypothetical protein